MMTNDLVSSADASARSRRIARRRLSASPLALAGPLALLLLAGGCAGSSWRWPFHHDEPSKAVQPTVRPVAEQPLMAADDPLLAKLGLDGQKVRLVLNEGPARVYEAEEGKVSYYKLPQKTASGDHYDPGEFTAAHKDLPFGTVVRCTRLDNGRSTVVQINDRGPHVDGRILDLSVAAAREIGLIKGGIAPARIEVLAYPQSQD